MKAVILTRSEWRLILEQLHKDYPPSVLAISENCKKRLGFTTRFHRRWIKSDEPNSISALLGSFLEEPTNYGYYQEEVHLDFYDECKRTFFLLKYGEFIGAEVNNR